MKDRPASPLLAGDASANPRFHEVPGASGRLPDLDRIQQRSDTGPALSRPDHHRPGSGAAGHRRGLARSHHGTLRGRQGDRVVLGGEARLQRRALSVGGPHQVRRHPDRRHRQVLGLPGRITHRGRRPALRRPVGRRRHHRLDQRRRRDDRLTRDRLRRGARRLGRQRRPHLRQRRPRGLDRPAA